MNAISGRFIPAPAARAIGCRQRPEALVDRLVLLVEPALQHEPVQEPQRGGEDEHAPPSTVITTADSVASPAAASSSVSSGGST